MSATFKIVDYNYVTDPTVTITATTENSDYPASNIGKEFRSKVWRSTTAATAQSVVLDLMTSEPIDTFAILFDSRIGCKLSDAATIYIQANPTDVWTAPAFSQQVYFDNTFDSITAFFASHEYRFWRINISDIGNAYGYIELGTVILGKDIELGRCADNGFELTLDGGSVLSTNLYGNTYVDEYPMVRELSFNFNIMTKTQQLTLETMYRRSKNNKPIFVALDTAEEMFDKDQFCIYGRMEDKYKQKHIVKDFFSGNLKIRESL